VVDLLHQDVSWMILRSCYYRLNVINNQAFVRSYKEEDPVGSLVKC
jgi:hypothetical protein